MYENFKEAVKGIIKEEQILCGESLAKHTTFRIGGPADLFLQPKNEDQISELVRFCNEKEIPFYIMGMVVIFWLVTKDMRELSYI